MGYQTRHFAEMDQVSLIHGILTILRVKEVTSTLKQQKGNCLDQVSLLYLIDAPLGVASPEKLLRELTH